MHFLKFYKGCGDRTPVPIDPLARVNVLKVVDAGVLWSVSPTLVWVLLIYSTFGTWLTTSVFGRKCAPRNRPCDACTSRTTATCNVCVALLVSRLRWIR